MRHMELPPLTGIRFYAALFVFLSHVSLLPQMESLTAGYLIFDAGVVGVSFFFVLSGFILTYNYADVFRSGVTVANYERFVWGRLTKIYPVHLFALAIILPIAMFSPNLPFDWRALPIHLLMLQCFLPFTQPAYVKFLNVPSWSISCEWFFYLLAPIVIFFALGRRRRWVPVVGAAVYICGIAWFLRDGQTDSSRFYYVYSFASSRMLEFLAGIFLARFFLTSTTPNLRTFSVLAQVAGIALIIAGAAYRKYAPWPFWGGLLYIPGSSLLILGLAYGRGALVTHLSGRWLHTLGTASFSLYMIHTPILRAVKGICFHFGWSVRTWPSFWLVAITMFALVQSIALVLCYRYEIPVQNHLRGVLKPKETGSSGQIGEVAASIL